MAVSKSMHNDGCGSYGPMVAGCRSPIKADVVIIGGGPAGLAAAVKLKELGVNDVVILEREKHLGGILRQCIHDGFGITRFQQALSGPEYAARFIDQVQQLGIEYVTEATVIRLDQNRRVLAASRRGLLEYEAKAVVLAMGCRERTRGAISIPGSRPAGVYTAGVAQAYMNLKNIMVGKRAVILGSGDIGLIMARRMTLEGMKVEAVFEILPYPSGLPRNIEQCLNDYQIPLYLSHTVTEIHGEGRLQGVTVSQVDEQLQPIKGSGRHYACDTLILSVGLIPENELSLMAGVQLDPRTRGALVDERYQTSVPGIFAAGNVLHVHDLVDFVSLEAERLSKAVADWLQQGRDEDAAILIETDANIGYTVPQRICDTGDCQISLRVRRPLRDCRIRLLQDETTVASKRLTKAVPAEMIHLHLKQQQLVSKNNIKVVLEHA
jgi:NADPH-dependent 2,4-dienoyl-CoA reductase/sulfur reductase-like enzyme